VVHKKKLLTFISLALSVVVLTVAAIPTNWFEAAKITGVVVKTESSTVTAIIDLGDLASATAFSTSGDGTITVAESGGLKIEKFMMGQPEYTPEEGWVYERYLTSRFYRLGLNLTIGQQTVSMPIVTNGTFYSYYNWYSEYSEYIGSTSWRYYRYYYWSAITLPQGIHTATFKIFGTTTLTNKTLGVEMKFYFALTPP